MTLSEVLLWNRLKGRSFLGLDFHRQKPIGRYIVDFYCPKLLLAIEIDGCSHDGRMAEDRARQKEIEKFGIRFLRFSDEEVKRDFESVVNAIEKWIETEALSREQHRAKH